MEINEIKNGFKLLNIREVNDINATLYEYEHLYSGGRVAYLKTDDTNCSFAIGFRTLPKDSTGVCHIIEHSTLCGSKKYPLKEPFVNLIKSSLNTFLNAFTAYDWTMYPFASQTPKDFDNILSIYCDAVFNPMSVQSPKAFLQEGWHLELLDEKDVPSYKGVVYNEMKGAMSSVDEVLVQTTLEAMYKDTGYAFNSGGDPDVIPNLTYEAYCNFYKEHYTPENALAIFYGDMDIDARLAFLDKEYYSKYAKTGKIEQIVPQAALINHDYTKEYEIGAEEDIKDNTYMSLCYGLDHYSNYEDMLGMSILCDALLSTNESPLKKALLEANLGQDIEARIDDDNIVPALHIYLQKSNPENKQKFKEVFEGEVAKLVKDGINHDILLACINNSEFKMKEADMGRMPKGLVYSMSMIGDFLYGNDLMIHLEFNKYFKKFKENLDKGYFEQLLDKYILKSTHNVEVMITPSKTLGAEKAKAMKELMEAKKASMNEDEIKALVQQTKELIEYQNHIDTPEELSCLPSLELSDVRKDINYLESTDIDLGDINGFKHVINTNEIAYLRMYFDLSSLSFDELAYASVLTGLYFSVPTKKHDVITLNNLKRTYLGDLNFGVNTISKSKDNTKVFLGIYASALRENVKYIPELINEVINETVYPEKEVKQLITQSLIGLKQGIIGNGMRVAMNEAKAAYSADAAYNIQLSGSLKRYRFLNELNDNFDINALSEKLVAISKKIFNKSNLRVSLSGDEETISLLKGIIPQLQLGNEQYPSILKPEFNKVGKKAVIIPSGVSYNAIAFNVEQLGYQYKGTAAVLSHIVTYDYLWNEIRVKGGAYGCNFHIVRTCDLALGSYRDPNVQGTFDNYKKIGEYLRNFKVSDKEFKNYIIGAVGGFDAPSSIPTFINSSDLFYIAGISKEERMAVKQEVLNTTIEDINNYASIVDEATLKGNIVTIGNEDKIKEYNFDEVVSL